MKVYVVTSGSYSDYGIHSIHSTRERAQFFAERIWGGNDVEEWEVDEPNPAAFPPDMEPYYVRFDRNGIVEDVRRGSIFFDWTEPPQTTDLVRDLYVFTNGPSDGQMQMTVWARDEDHARKAAQDRRAQWLAEQAGIT